MRNEIMRRRVRTMLMMQADARDGTVTMNLGPHAGFIVTAYAAAIAIVAGLIAWIVFDRRQLSRMLDDFEAHGHQRGARSARMRRRRERDRQGSR